jgi:hypothetical protein
LTQAIARWAHERGYHGIAYKSRFDDAFDYWAIFEEATFTPDPAVEPITPSDPDLRTVAALFNLAI